jgi:hypothetical protein
MSTKNKCLGIILALSVGAEEKKKMRRMKEWFKKQHIFSHENLLNEIEISEPGDYTNFFAVGVSTYDLLQMAVTL